VSAPTPTADDLALIRQRTNGATNWTDESLAQLASEWTITADDDTVTLDLWAAAAMVLEYRLLQALENPVTGTAQARTGDALVGYRTAGASTYLLRSFIRRYWRAAHPANRARAHPSGWRTLDVQAASGWRRFLPATLEGAVVNGPD
jgi:hypothetical protein